MNATAGAPAPLSYTFNGLDLRVVVTDGEPWFVAADVCQHLGLVNVSDAVSRLDEDERDDLALTDTVGRRSRMLGVSESGLYDLVLRSDKPEGKPFRRWVRKEVLPSIRKTGRYELRPQSDDTGLAVERILRDENSRLKDVIIGLKDELLLAQQSRIDLLVGTRRRATTARMTQAEIAELARRYAAGEPILVIAGSMDRTTQAVRYQLRRLGVYVEVEPGTGKEVAHG